MRKQLLQVDNLTVRFAGQREPAVDKVSLKIRAGKTLGLVGESGSGKSVTALSIMRLLSKHDASVEADAILFDGANLMRTPEKKLRQLRGNRVAMIFQEPMTALNPVFKIGTQIAEVLRTHMNMPKKAAWTRAAQLLRRVGMDDPQRQIEAYPHELSGGQKQRVMIAMAIACEPELLICDEPTTALDVTIQKQVLELLKNLQQYYQMSMLFISHDLSVIAQLADEVAVMRIGKIVEYKPTEQLFRHAEHPYTRGLLACRPRLGQKTRRLLTIYDFDSKNFDPKAHKQEAQKKKLKKRPLLEARGIKTWYPVKTGFWNKTTSHVKAVDGIDLTVYKGETLGLVGESGSGKTTLGRTLLRLQQATEGEVIYDGINLMQQSAEKMRALRSRMQIIFQDPYSSLNPRMTVAATLTEPMRIHHPKRKRQQRLDKAVELLEKVSLNAEALYKLPHQFSGGQRQRICIARALAVEPEFIICDESVSALDVSVQAQIINLLMDLQEEFGLTYIFISHDLSVVNFISDRVGVMQKGKLVELNTAHRIYHSPKKNYTQRLLNAIPTTPFLENEDEEF
ncbi:ABC transporter ATP-binding protein [Marinicella sp. W31]|uniref:ABC transporter ATP-binding protein n=1 Tax=Marinicella sp. W31 TaxID=3023713 RepID=UPI003756A274